MLKYVGLLSALLATAISVIALSRIAYKEYDGARPITLSEMAASRQPLLAHFRRILVLCGTLFAVTMYLYVGPQASHSGWIIVAWTMTYFGELSLAIVPAHKGTMRLHNIFGLAMASGMLAMAYLFSLELSGYYRIFELLIFIVMTAMGVSMIIDKKHFIFYELGFIFLSHISIVIVAVALR